jgi:hypothetical protein
MTPGARSGWVVVCLMLTGCGGSSYKTPPVSGRVILDGKPLSNATVTFVPVAGPAEADKEPPPSSVGTTDQDGRYSLVLNSGGKSKGAVVGKHKVIITLGGQGTPDDTKPTFHKQLPERYNRKTDLTCDVPPDGRTDADFDLKSK